MNYSILIVKMGKLKSKIKAKLKFKKAQRINQGKKTLFRHWRPPLPNVAVPAKRDRIRGDRRAVVFFSRWKAKAPRKAEKGRKECENEKRWKRENTEPIITGNSKINAFISEHAEFLDSVEALFWWWLLQFVGSWNKPLSTILLPVSPNLSTLFKSKSLEECYISRKDKDEDFCSSFANWCYQETWNLDMGIQTLFLESLYSMRSCPKMIPSYFKVFTFQQQLKIWCHCPRLRRTLQNLSLG